MEFKAVHVSVQADQSNKHELKKTDRTLKGYELQEALLSLEIEKCPLHNKNHQHR